MSEIKIPKGKSKQQQVTIKKTCRNNEENTDRNGNIKVKTLGVIGKNQNYENQKGVVF